MLQTIFLTLSIIIAFLSVVPYILDVLRGKTKPNFVTWFTWTLLSAIASVAAFAAGEYVTALLIGAEAVMTGSVAVLSIRYGHTKYTVFDIACQLAALVGLVLWLLFDSPVIAIIASVTIDFIGTLPTLRHAWRKPKEETAQTYGISALSDGLGVMALTVFNPVSATYVVYNLVIDILLAVIIVARRPGSKLVHFRHHRRVLHAKYSQKK